MTERTPDLAEILQVLNLSQKGYVIFDDVEDMTQFTQGVILEYMQKAFVELADAWELESLSHPELTFQNAIEAIRVAAAVMPTSKKS